MYASIADLRAEGVTVAEASDARLELLLEEASRLIDRVTGWFFEPRLMTLRLSGRGGSTIELPVPPIRLDRLMLGSSELPLDAEHLLIVGAPVQPGFDTPYLTRRYARFPRGHGNVVAKGLWGFTEYDGTPTGRTPPAIRRATMLLVLRNLTPLADDAAFEARSKWRIIEERTRDQSYKLDGAKAAAASASLTGDPDVDALLALYVRPAPLGAA